MWILCICEPIYGSQALELSDADMNPIIKDACELAWEFRRMITDRDGKKVND
jgi:hypothetical protein